MFYNKGILSDSRFLYTSNIIFKEAFKLIVLLPPLHKLVRYAYSKLSTNAQLRILLLSLRKV